MQFTTERAEENLSGGDAQALSSLWGLWIAIGATFGLLGVIMGAAGTHALEDRIDADALDTLETAVRFQMYHAIVLVVLGGLSKVWERRELRISGALFTFGTIVFCGSLYLIALVDIGAFGAVAPIGGLSLMAGWGALALGAARSYMNSRRDRSQ